MESGNPFRPLMEYMANWHLIERSEADILRLCAEAGIHEGRVEVGRDATRLTLLVSIEKPDK
jgi:extracellular factor (EF) 3-hydroxypalmitic acid methyl ester biosynthesis protein